MKNIKRYESFIAKLGINKNEPIEKTSKTVTKGDKTFKISYWGPEDPNKDGFLLHFTGYDRGIGNDIVGFYDCGPYETCSDNETLKSIMDEVKTAITSGFSYCNANEVIDFYIKCIKTMNIGMVEQYKKTLEKHNFKLEEI